MALETLIAGVMVVTFCIGVSIALLTSCRCKDNRAVIKRITRWIALFLIVLGMSETLATVADIQTLPASMTMLQTALSLGAFTIMFYASVLVYRYSVRIGFKRSAYLKGIEQKK